MSTSGMEVLNSKYAWREVACRDLPKRPASERVADFLEIYGLYDEQTAREQASRCLQCPNPSCVGGCPLCNPIPQWMLLTAEGRFLEAAAVLGSATNLAEICARLCPQDRMCEGACILNGASEPVSIRALEQFLCEHALAHGQADTTTAPPNGLRVAVAGSGPGGLACADELAKGGYAVTLLDSALLPGGLLVNGLPAFKVERSIVQRRIELLQKRGVVFRLGVKLGADLTLTQLRAGFDAVYLGFDSRQARPLEVPGAGLPGVVQAIPFLLQKTTAVPLELAPLEVSGKRVVVVGGGDTAMDCLRAALRYGAREALGVYRRAQEDMPCSRREFDNAVEEGARFVFRAAPLAVLDRGRGSVAGLRLIRTEPGAADASGRRPVSVVPGSEFDLEADWIVSALGFAPLPCPRTEDFSELAINEWGGLVVDAGQMTNLPGVFAGGDLVRGPSPVLHAVRDARRAAAQIAAYLSPRQSTVHSPQSTVRQARSGASAERR
jgi:glutamate synthase (NADPH/NADH) small chain